MESNLGKSVKDLFRLDGKVAVITGGAGLLGIKHAEAIAEQGGSPVLLDKDSDRLQTTREELQKSFGSEFLACAADITDRDALEKTIREILKKKGQIDILINNAAMTVESAGGEKGYFDPFEDYSGDLWEKALRVSLTGAFHCTQLVGTQMKALGSGVILNIASDLSVISPDHRIYQAGDGYHGTPFNTPISYAVAKSGLIGFTRYLATYWAPDNIRVNALSPGGVFNHHDPEFVKRLSQLIPLGRMAKKDEYKGAVVFLVSDASSFMTGFNVVMDGGRSCW